MYILELSLQDLNPFEHSNTETTKARELTMLTLAGPCDLDLETLTWTLSP